MAFLKKKKQLAFVESLLFVTFSFDIDFLSPLLTALSFEFVLPSETSFLMVEKFTFHYFF